MGRPPRAGWQAFRLTWLVGTGPGPCRVDLFMAWLSSEHPLRARARDVARGLSRPGLGSRTPSVLFARVSCEVLPRSGAEQELPPLPLEGRRMEEFVDPFLNPRSLSDSNEQGKETRVPELSEEGGRSCVNRVASEVTPGG